MEFNGFTQKASEALCKAVGCAMSFGHTYIGSEHILYGLTACEGSVAGFVLAQNGVKLSDIGEKISSLIGKGLPTRLTVVATGHSGRSFFDFISLLQNLG